MIVAGTYSVTHVRNSEINKILIKMKFHVFLKKTLTKGLIKLSPGKSYIHVSLITDNNCVQNTDKSENRLSSVNFTHFNLLLTTLNV
jgi:hypothetical protein